MKLQLPKLPKLSFKRPAIFTRKSSRPKPPMKLNAATAAQRMKPGVDDYDDDEPQTRLSSAFFVVLILHVVAVGGIYAFNSIKEHRRGLDPRPDTAKTEPVEKPAPAPAPAKAAAAASTEVAAKPAAPAHSPVITTPVSNSKVYQVKAGDTLTSIAKHVGTSVVALQLANKDTNILKPGQILNIPAKSASAVIEPPAPNPSASRTESVPARKTEPAPPKAASATPGSYEVKKGDTATSIAKRLGVSVDELLKLNKVADPKKLQLGQTLKVPSKKN